MGRASREKALRRQRMQRMQQMQVEQSTVQTAEEATGHRYVPYTNLLATGRAVRYYNRGEHGWWLEVPLAGDQGGDRGPDAKQAFYLGFETEQSCKRTGDNLLFKLRRLHAQGRLNTDPRYNAVVEAFARAAEEEIKQQNAEVLARAERAVKGAPSVPTLLRDLVVDKRSRQ